MRVVAALSGGVDSAVAAARAVDAGHEVTGIHLALARSPQSHRTGARGCCTLEDARDARRVADVLGIPFYVWDLSERFAEEVIDDFIEEYAAGRTPNPCLRCNERIKFTAVLDRALALGFDAVSTGHYARIVDGPSGRELHRAVDPAKDQSYVLGVLDRAQLAGAMLPLGDSLKSEVRLEAGRRGLLVADKPDSHDICFIPDGDTAGWLRGHLGDAPGDVVDAESGETVGRHEGAFSFTVGQRRGLGLGRPAEDGARRYVVEVDTTSSTVLVGPPVLLEVDRIRADRPRWCGDAPDGPVEGQVQLRAHGEPVDAMVELSPSDTGPADEVVAHLRRRVRGVAPGQALVLYDGTRVVGSATIRTTSRA
jgi:tRNA-specific 2-thiouridylase